MSKLSIDAKIYYNSGSFESPTWVEIDEVKDVSLPLSKTEIDVTTRAANGWKWLKGGLKDGSIDLTAEWDGSTNIGIFITSFLTGSGIDILCLDGPVETEGSQGLRALMECFALGKTENLDDSQKSSISIKPTYSTWAPYWYTVQGSGS